MNRKIPAWTAKAVGQMHVYGITQIDVAEHLGVTSEYIGMILRGVERPKNAETRIMGAIKEILNGKRERTVSGES